MAVSGLAVFGQSIARAASDRSIAIYSIHTKETVSVVYKRDGRYVPSAMAKINTLLRDWRVNETVPIDPAVIDVIWELRRELGSTEPVQLISGYRSPRTNAMLRRQRGGQAKRSLHIAGKAIDVFFPGVPLKTLRNAALVKQRGGVGYYPRSGTPFVHIDTGSVRHWPRIPEQQLASIMKGKGKYRPGPRTLVASVKPKPKRTAPLVLASAALPEPANQASKPAVRRWGESWMTPTRRPGPKPRRKPQAVVTAQNSSAEFPLGVVTAYAQPNRSTGNDNLTAMIEGQPTALPELLANPGLMRELSGLTASSQVQMPTRQPAAPGSELAAPIVTASLAPEMVTNGQTTSQIGLQVPVPALAQTPVSSNDLDVANDFTASPFDRPSRQRFDPSPRLVAGLISTPASRYTNIFKGQLFATKVLYTFSVADQPGYLVAVDVRVAIPKVEEDETPYLMALARRAYAWLVGS
ncbi:MAG: DUF882 domain-containing protein [Hyphomicrobiales bacterium]